MHLPMMEGAGTTVYDASRYGNDGALNGCKWVENGLEFNGTSDYVDCGNNPSLYITGAITISAWINIAVDDTFRTIYACGYDGTYQNYIWVDIFNTNYPHFRIIKGGIGYNLFASKTVTVADGWSHIAFVWNGAIMKIAMNGIFDANTKPFTGTLAYDSTLTEIGRRTTTHYNGSIDEVRIYNRALSAAEIKRAYKREVHNYK